MYLLDMLVSIPRDSGTNNVATRRVRGPPRSRLQACSSAQATGPARPSTSGPLAKSGESNAYNCDVRLRTVVYCIQYTEPNTDLRLQVPVTRPTERWLDAAAQAHQRPEEVTFLSFLPACGGAYISEAWVESHTGDDG